MAEWHLTALKVALERRGWDVSELPGDDYRIAGSWRLHRSAGDADLFIDFDGLDDMRTLPMPQAYGCAVRGTAIQLYFSRRGERGSAARHRWAVALDEFTTSLDGVSTAPALIDVAQ